MTARHLDPSIARILSAEPPAFALVHRPGVTGPGVVEVLCGRSTTHGSLAEVSASRDALGLTGPHREVLLLVPFRQAVERGFEVVDDGAELIAVEVDSHTSLSLADLLDELPDEEVSVEDGRFETDGDTYVRQVREVIDEEIGRGQGSNFVVKRSFTGQLVDYDLRKALTLFRRLVQVENGAYWTFLVHAGDTVLVGASPERHLSCRDGLAVMNPISGTYRYPPSGPDVDELVAFLNDRKETDELNMVVDEELKMMARVCDDGVRVTGPFLKEMAHLAHTEYYVQGRTSRSSIDLLRETLFAPTVVGSPLENAFRVIARRERAGRGYYSGCVALIGHDRNGRETLDSAILIRTAEIDRKGRIDIGVGATLLRHSDPASEVAETESKVAGLLGVLADGAGSGRPAAPPVPDRGLGMRSRVVSALVARNSRLASFWFTPDDERRSRLPRFDGYRALVLDAEDAFTSMLAYQLRSLGLDVEVRDVRDDSLLAEDPRDHDFVVLGPGPGDPRDVADPKMARLRQLLLRVRGAGVPLLAVCLGHQVLCAYLGLEVLRLDIPDQGAQREVELFGTKRRLGFYNTFVVTSPVDRLRVCGIDLEVDRDPATGHVRALRGPGLRSLQFHPESILTRSGVDLLADCVGGLVPVRQALEVR
ncbi:anthranilate synthase family protein [Saccharothrix sp. BKS2]|uniref:anthranilate synthase family protein n=1 Tax=Saccharothrix sp. BKS2 TaxID=3064400 RepID=UPI0039EAECFF